MDNIKKYYAFISYKREDEEWAKWLQHKLEHYKLPSNLNGRTDLPKEIRPIFRDQSELAAGVLADEIQKALEASKYLIVICSPRAAQSQWVGKEVQSFIDMGRTEKIIPFIVGGAAHAQNPEDECFPSALLNLPADQELLGVNVDEMGRDAAAVKVVAQMFGLKFDALWQRYEREQRRRRFLIIGVALLLALAGVTVALGFSRQNKKITEQNERITKQNEEIVRQSEDIQRKNDRLMNDSVIMAAQLDSINRRDALIESQKDSILITNLQLTTERNNLQQTNWNLKLFNTRFLSEVIMNHLQSGELIKGEAALRQLCKDNQINWLKELPEMEQVLRSYYRYKTSEGVRGLYSLENMDISFVQLSEDGNYLYIGLNDRIQQYDSKTGELLKEMGPPDVENEYVSVIGFDEKSNSILYIYGSVEDSAVFLCKKDIGNNNIIRLVRAPEFWDFYISPNLRYFIYSVKNDAENKKDWYVIDLEDEHKMARMIPNCEWVYSFSGDNSKILVLINEEYSIYDIKRGKVVGIIPDSKSVAYERKKRNDKLKFGYDDKLVIVILNCEANYYDNNSYSRSGLIELYSIESGKYLEYGNPISIENEWFDEAEVSSDGNFLITKDTDGKIRFYEIKYVIRGSKHRVIYDLLFEINANHFDYCNGFVMKMVSGGGIMLTESQSLLKIWDINIHSKIYRWLDSYEYISPFGTSYIGETPNHYALFDANTNKKVGNDLFKTEKNVNQEEWFKYISKNNQVVVTTNYFTSTICVWHPETSNCYKIPYRCNIYSLKMSVEDDGGIMAVYEGSDGGNKNHNSTLSVYDIEKKRLIGGIDSLDFLSAFCVSPSGANLALVGEGKNLYIYDVNLALLKLLSKTPTEHQYISDLTYSPDGSYLVSCGSEGVVCLWDAKKMKLYKKFCFREQIKKCSVSPDNCYLIANVNLSGNIKSYILNIESEQVVETLEGYSDCEFCRVGSNRLIASKEDGYQYIPFPTLDEIIDLVNSPQNIKVVDDSLRIVTSSRYKILMGQ